MFLTTEYSRYDRRGQQLTGGRFLVLASPDIFTSTALQLPAETRKTIERMLFGGVFRVRMSQFGHFMMGTLRLGGKSITLSGPFGTDGGPIRMEKIPTRAFHRYFVQVPPAVAEAYWTEARNAETLLRQWARRTFPLRRR